MFPRRWVTNIETEMSNPNVLGIYASGASGLQPFDWAMYICFGGMQFALTIYGGTGKFAFREYSDHWSAWQIIVGS